MLLSVFIKRTMRKLAGIAPTNFLRVLALRLAGYHIGKEVWIGQGLIIIDDNMGGEKLYIGDRVAIAPRVTVILQSYPNNSRIREIVPTCNGDIVIGADAWIGAGVIIKPDIKIGQASVVGAGSIVTKSVAEGTIVVGNPARYLRSITTESELEMATKLDEEFEGDGEIALVD
ncbi:MAG: acyltransferase [Actinobacteria bacterium]|nr:acyltransferase [Actinomycetota bacterium]